MKILSNSPGVLAAAIVLATVLAGCNKPEQAAKGEPSTSGPVLPGVVPNDGNTQAASDRPGAPATGAIEAGQASGGKSTANAAQPTGGDGSPGAPASAAASR